MQTDIGKLAARHAGKWFTCTAPNEATSMNAQCGFTRGAAGKTSPNAVGHSVDRKFTVERRKCATRVLSREDGGLPWYEFRITSNMVAVQELFPIALPQAKCLDAEFSNLAQQIKASAAFNAQTKVLEAVLVLLVELVKAIEALKNQPANSNS